MGFSVVCHGSGETCDDGRDMIAIYQLRRKTNGKCPGCGKMISVDSLSIEVDES